MCCPDDLELAAFLQLMQPRRKTAIWSNEDGMLGTARAQARAPASKAGKKPTQPGPPVESEKQEEASIDGG